MSIEGRQSPPGAAGAGGDAAAATGGAAGTPPAAASGLSGTTRRWSKWASGLFKRDRPLGSEPWFNPETITEQKREWLEQQSALGQQAASWPEHIFENFFIVGLPPDMELTQVAEQLCEMERKQRHHDSDSDSEHGGGKEHIRPPQPSFAPQVLFRFPAGGPAPISDAEVAALAFPAGVAPEKLRRTPSLSALDELIMGRDSDAQQQCFVFMLKVGGNFPLYGCCWYAKETLHRPPYLARQAYRSCRAPFRQCMIAAPRCYCLLSHYPFFELHFRVIKIVLDLERLERLLEYDAEKAQLPPPPLGAPLVPLSTSTRASRRSVEAAAQVLSPHGGGSRAPSAAGGRSGALSPVAGAHAVALHNKGAYCAECARIIEDMCPFTPGTSPTTGDSGRRGVLRGSLGDEGQGEQQQQQQPEQQPRRPQLRLVPHGHCEVCGRALRSADGGGGSADGTPEAVAAALSAPLGAAGTAQPQGPGGAGGFAPKGWAAAAAGDPASPPGGSLAHFDAIAAAVSSFDAAAVAAGAPRDGSAVVAVEPAGGDAGWASWQHVMSAIRGGASATGPALMAQELRDGLPASASDPAPHETSMVQRMWEVWAPKSPSSAACGTSSGGRASGGLTGGLTLFKRSSKGSLASPLPLLEPQQQQQQQQQPTHQQEQLLPLEQQRKEQLQQQQQQQQQQDSPPAAAAPAAPPEHHQQQPAPGGSGGGEAPPGSDQAPAGSAPHHRHSQSNASSFYSVLEQPELESMAAAAGSSCGGSPRRADSSPFAKQRQLQQQEAAEEARERAHLQALAAASAAHAAGIMGGGDVHASGDGGGQQGPGAVGARGSGGVSQHGSVRATGDAGAHRLVSAFAAIAASASPFTSAAPSPYGSRLATPEPRAAVSPANSAGGTPLPPRSASGDGCRARSSGGGGGGEAAAGGDTNGRTNVTIGGSIAGQQEQLQAVALAPPVASHAGSISRGSSKRSALFEEMALRRSGDMSAELRNTISHLVQADSCSLLSAYHSSPVPLPGEAYRLMLGDLYRLEFERSLPLPRYAPPGRSRLQSRALSYAEVECAQQLQLWTVAALCRSLSLDNVITLVNAALLEKQLVVFCPHIGTLAAVVLSLVPLLRPFAWQSLMMPVTPSAMLGFLEAPVPFVLGVQFKTPGVASRCHGLMRVNVYKDAIKAPSFPPLPHARSLAAALAPHHAALAAAAPLAAERPVHLISPDEEDAARALLAAAHDFLSQLCGDLRLHTIVNVGMSKRTGVFMRESLIESAPARDRPFLRAFTETQMFAAYADGVISDYCEG